jgi:hypothetical protein
MRVRLVKTAAQKVDDITPTRSETDLDAGDGNLRRVSRSLPHRCGVQKQSFVATKPEIFNMISFVSKQ